MRIRKNKIADGINKPLESHKYFLQKILMRDFFFLAPAANMLGTSRFFIGCMKLQHAVTLELTWETESIRIFFPA